MPSVEGPRLTLMFDVGALCEPDQWTLEVLARLQLHARRMGATITLCNARPSLLDLLTIAGLSEVLPCVDVSGVEVRRHTEEREEVAIDEVVDPGDASA